MASGGALRTGLLLALLGALSAPWPASSSAAEPPPVVPTPGLALSDKPPPGCCCIYGDREPRRGGCSFGLQADKCKTAGAVFPNSVTSWTPGKCPGR